MKRLLLALAICCCLLPEVHANNPLQGATATVDFFLYEPDGTAVTTGTPVETLSKNGAAAAACANDATHIADGLWTLTLATTETNANHLSVRIAHADAMGVVLNLYPWNGTTGVSIGTGGVTTASFAAGAIDAAAIATDAIGSPELATTAWQEIQAGLATATQLDAVKTRTDRIPDVAAGAAGGLLIAGNNAGTTFAALTSTGAFTANGEAVGGITVTETRDLETPAVSLKLPSRKLGRAYVAHPIRIVPGETVFAGFDLLDTIVLPAGAVPATMSTPTGLTGEMSSVKRGIGSRYANFEVIATEAAEPGDEQWLEVQITNSLGQGPFILNAKVIVIEPHP